MKADLVITIRSSEVLDRLVVWLESWAEFLPDAAKDEFLAVMRDGLMVDRDRES